jgi:putative ABC transport system permease protein
LLDKPLPALSDFYGYVFIGILIFSVFTGFIAGLYPAVVLSGFRIVTAVKGKLPAFGEGKFLRKALLSFQIGVACFVLTCSVIIARQLYFIQHFDLGYDGQGVLVITSVPREWSEAGVSKIEAVRNDFLNEGDVVSASVSYEVPDGNAGNRYNFRNDERKEVDMPLLTVDENFAKTFDLELLTGNFFFEAGGNYQGNRVILNEKAVADFGWTPASAIGRQIIYDGHEEPLVIVGVVNNFHFSSLFESVAPISLIHMRDRLSYRYLSIRMTANDRTAAVEEIKKKWTAIFPGAPFDYVFMEDRINQFYAVENRIYKSSKLASLLVIIITLSGLIAFMSVSLTRRIKEIGIRRIHGASSANLVLLLLEDFSGQFIIGGILAWLPAYYFLTSWLSSFQYSVGLPFYIFPGVHLGLLVLISAFIIGYSLRTVRMNPVISLRYE